jgi:hypothetical protein
MATDNVVVNGVKPGDVPVPADYAALGVVSGYKPRPAEELRLFLTGPSGKGKTTFLSSIPDTLILDFELGADAIPGARAARVRVEGYPHYESLINKLVGDGQAKKPKFKRIGIDTGDEWMHAMSAQLAHEHNVEDITEYGTKGHGWGLIRSRCWAGIQALQAAGYSWAIVGHLTEKTISNPLTKTESTVLRPVLFDTLAKQILRNSDFYATIWMEATQEQEMETINVRGKEIQRPKRDSKVIKRWWFDCRSIDGGDGKGRGVPTMRERFELPLVNGWDVFVDEYNQATEKIKKGEF